MNLEQKRMSLGSHKKKKEEKKDRAEGGSRGKKKHA